MVLCLLASSNGFAATGGPDTYGYTWRDVSDGATYSWIDISGTGTDLGMGDESLSAPQSLGFSVTFYGNSYSQILVSANGWITFDLTESSANYTNYGIPSTSGPEDLVAAFWDDLNPGSAGNVYFQSFADHAVVSWVGVPRYGTADAKTFQIVIRDTGLIEIQYQASGTTINTATVGIENAIGDDGLQCQYDATTAPGWTLADSYAVDFVPPAAMDCTAATPVACDGNLGNQAMGTISVASLYGCGGGTYDGNERIFQLDVASTQNVDIAIANFGPDALDVFLLDACAAGSCLAGGGDTISIDNLPAGTYYVVVDGATSGDDGPFDLDVSCNDAATIACPGSCTTILHAEDFSGGLPGNWNIVDGGTTADTWYLDNVADPGSCANTDPNAPAADNWMAVDSDCAGSGNTLVETLATGFDVDCTVGGPYSQILLKFDHYFNAIGGDLAEVYARSTATGGSWTNVASWTSDTANVESAAIDITAQALNQTDLRVGWRYDDAGLYAWYWYLDNVEICGVQGADCAGAQTISCPYSATDSTAGGSTEFSAYGCSNDAFMGSEKIYRIDLTSTTQLDVALSNFGARDLEVMLLGSCDACSCISHGSTLSEILQPGTYFLVVDGYTPADDGTFSIDVTCTDPCALPPPITCNATIAADTTGQGNDLDDPGLTCVGGGPGPDQVHRLDYVGPAGSTIWAEATPTGGWDHIIYSLSDCTDVTSCLDGADSGPITWTTTGSPETSYVVVDGWSAAAEGPYTLDLRCFSNQLACGSAEPGSCWDVITVDTAGAPQNVFAYGCAGGDHAGPEKIYEITTTVAGDLTATLTNIVGDDLDLAILDAGCSVGGCLAEGDTTATVTAAPPGTYYVVVDTDRYSSAGTAQLQITCPLGNGLSCSSPTSLACNSEVDGDTQLGSPSQSRYTCGGRDLTGSEVVYQFTLASSRWVRATLSNTGGRDLDLVLLNSCDPNDCVTHEDVEVLQLLGPGTYTLLVDGVTPVDDGSFHLEFLCIEPSTLTCGFGCAANQNPILSESFEAPWIPAGWSTADNIGSGNLWSRNDTFGATNQTTGTGFSAAADDLSGGDWDAELISPAVDLTGATTVSLLYKSNFQDFAGAGQAWLDISTDGGTIWSNLTYWTDDWGPTDESINLDAYAGQTVNLRWRYTDDAYVGAWYWHIDDVQVCADIGPAGGLDCGSVTPITCGDTLSGQTMGAANNEDEYSCSPYRQAGAERIYSFTLTEVRTVTIDVNNFGDEDLSVFLLDSCDNCNCLQGGGPPSPQWGSCQGPTGSSWRGSTPPTTTPRSTSPSAAPTPAFRSRCSPATSRARETPRTTPTRSIPRAAREPAPRRSGSSSTTGRSGPT